MAVGWMRLTIISLATVLLYLGLWNYGLNISNSNKYKEVSLYPQHQIIGSAENSGGQAQTIVDEWSSSGQNQPLQRASGGLKPLRKEKTDSVQARMDWSQKEYEDYEVKSRQQEPDNPESKLPELDDNPESTLPEPDDNPESTLPESDDDPESSLPEPDDNSESTLPEPDDNPESTWQEPDDSPESTLPEPDDSPESTLPEPDDNPESTLPEPDDNPESTLQEPDDNPESNENRRHPHAVDPTLGKRFIPHREIDWHGTLEPYVFAYSAYYDDRQLKFEADTVVILGLMSKIAKQQWKDAFKCVVHYSNFDKQVVIKPTIHFLSGMLFITSEKVTITDFVFWCPLKTSGHLPSNVSIMINRKTLFSMPVIQPPRPKEVGDLLVCTKAIYVPHERNYEALDVGMFVEWVELNRMLGVEHITVYIHSLTEDFHKIFYYYYKTGYFDFVSLGPINWDNYVLPRALGVNDCLYWNMYSYRKLVNIDPDEVLVPRQFSTLTDFLDDLPDDEPISGVVFQPKVFYTDARENGSFYLRFIENSKYVTVGNSKSIVNMNGCMKVSAHRCLVAAAHHKSIPVKLEDGASYHFKTCETARVSHRPSDCSEALKEAKKDIRMKSFKAQLQARVVKVLQELDIDIQ